LLTLIPIEVALPQAKSPLDDMRRVVHSEIVRVTTELVGQRVSVENQPAFYIPDRNAEDTKVPAIQWYAVGLAFLDVPPVIDIGISQYDKNIAFFGIAKVAECFRQLAPK
jgi:hypothetical protein